MSKNSTVLGIVPNRAVAERVIADLVRAGFPASDVSVLLANDDSTRDIALEHGTKAPVGAVAGGTTGGAVGGTLGVLAGMGLLAIPGVGPFVAAGPIMAALSGAALGAAVGSLTGALVGLGVPEVRAKTYEGKLRTGGALVSVHAEDKVRVEAAQKIFALHRAEDVSTTSESSLPRATQEARR